MYIFLYVCMYVCMHVRMYVCRYAFVYLSMYVRMHACMHACVGGCICMCIHILEMCRGIHTHTHTHTHTALQVPSNMIYISTYLLCKEALLDLTDFCHCRLSPPLSPHSAHAHVPVCVRGRESGREGEEGGGWGEKGACVCALAYTIAY